MSGEERTERERSIADAGIARDELAARAMQGLVSRNVTYRSNGELAIIAYSIADAMIYARETDARNAQEKAK